MDQVKFKCKRTNVCYQKGCWQLPGGHLEKNESWEQCAIRETLEETNLKVTKTKFLHVTNDIFENEDKHYITIFLKAIEWEGIPKVMEPNKVESWEWIEWNKGLPSPLFLPLNNLIKDGISPI